MGEILTTWNEISGGSPSVAMAIITTRKTPNVTVWTGGGLPWALKRMWRLRQLKYKVIMLSSFTAGYSTYFDYIRKNDLKPFYMSCCDKAKERHLNHFFNALTGQILVNVGFIKGDERRAERLRKNHTTKKISFSFPVLDLTRADCEQVLIDHGFKPDNPEADLGERFKKTGCHFCPKQPNPPKWVLDKFHKLYGGGEDR